MSRPPKRENEPPLAPPNVYLPQPTASPAYEEYADPAAAHGWQNAYDETAQLPPVADAGAEALGGAAPVRAEAGGEGAGDGYDYSYSYSHGPNDDYNLDLDHDQDYGFGDGRRGRRGEGAGRGTRRKPSTWRSRRVAVMAGAVGAVSVAALIAGFSLSGSSPEGDVQVKQDRTSPTADDSADPTEPSDGTSADARPPDATEPSRSQPATASANPSATDDPTDKAGKPSPTPSTSSTAPTTPTASPTTPDPGNANGNPGRGQGNTKGPK